MPAPPPVKENASRPWPEGLEESRAGAGAVPVPPPLLNNGGEEKRSAGTAVEAPVAPFIEEGEDPPDSKNPKVSAF